MILFMTLIMLLLRSGRVAPRLHIPVRAVPGQVWRTGQDGLRRAGPSQAGQGYAGTTRAELSRAGLGQAGTGRHGSGREGPC